MKGQMRAIQRGLFTSVLILVTAGLPARGQYAGGSGTADDPYLIETAEQLNEIYKSTSFGRGQRYWALPENPLEIAVAKP
jgi:hypothetical protein